MIHDIINNVYKEDYKAETSAEVQPQSTSNAPLNKSQSSKLREKRSQQLLPFNSQDENRSDLRRLTRTRKPPDRFGSSINSKKNQLCEIKKETKLVALRDKKRKKRRANCSRGPKTG